MKNIYIPIVFLSSVLLTSCLSNPGGSSEKYQVIPAARNGVILMVDKENGKLYRAKLVNEGKPTWEYLGSPSDAK